MRLDHIAYRTACRYKTADFFRECLGYNIDTEFKIEFGDGTTAECLALVPPESRPTKPSEWTNDTFSAADVSAVTFYAPSEIFVSDGPAGSIVGDWVNERAGVGGIHHIAYQVDDVGATMEKWKEKGYVEFLSEHPLDCPGLRQVFTKPSELTGIIYELISREGDGFCKENVKGLMESTKGLS